MAGAGGQVTNSVYLTKESDKWIGNYDDEVFETPDKRALSIETDNGK